MLCSQCQANPATLHLEATIDGRKTSSDLCASCAQKTGIAAPLAASGGAVNFPALPPALAALFGSLSHWAPPAAKIADACPRCRWTLGDFRRTGKMGCPDCYVHFHRAAERILADVQGSVTHKGRKPVGR